MHLTPPFGCTTSSETAIAFLNIVIVTPPDSSTKSPVDELTGVKPAIYHPGGVPPTGRAGNFPRGQTTLKKQGIPRISGRRPERSTPDYSASLPRCSRASGGPAPAPWP